MDILHSFSLIKNHIGKKEYTKKKKSNFIFLEFFVNSQEYENNDRSIIISLNEKMNSTFFILSKLDEYLNINQSSNILNSHIINLNFKQKPKENIQITFQHLNKLNNSNQISTCVYWDKQWSTDGCYLISSNSTHSICSYNHLSTFAVLMNFQKVKIYINRLSFISKIGCIVSIICLILTIIVLIIR